MITVEILGGPKDGAMVSVPVGIPTLTIALSAPVEVSRYDEPYSAPLTERVTLPIEVKEGRFVARWHES